MRYSALKVHQGREQGPSTDIQSVIFVVAEMISGRLPWRSVTTLRVVRELKEMFPDTHEFRRLPNEIRKLYRLVVQPTPVDPFRLQRDDEHEPAVPTRLPEDPNGLQDGPRSTRSLQGRKSSDVVGPSERRVSSGLFFR